MKTVSQVRDYQMTTADGKPIRKATEVEYSDGYIVQFTERLPHRAARAQADILRSKDEPERKVGDLVTVASLLLKRLDIEAQERAARGDSPVFCGAALRDDLRSALTAVTTAT